MADVARLWYKKGLKWVTAGTTCRFQGTCSSVVVWSFKCIKAHNKSIKMIKDQDQNGNEYLAARKLVMVHNLS